MTQPQAATAQIGIAIEPLAQIIQQSPAEKAKVTFVVSVYFCNWFHPKNAGFILQYLLLLVDKYFICFVTSK